MATVQLDTACLSVLAAHARQADERSVWPAASWEALKQLGALRWSVPREYGGDALSSDEILAGYEILAGACLTTCFILSQRDAACRRLRGSHKDELCRELFPGLATGERFMTVGLAQLTTSRQHGMPAVTASADRDTFIIDGVIPWVTGAPQADHILIGAALENDQQLLAVLPTDMSGVQVGQPLELAALQGSLTSEVRCDNVRLPRKWLLAGPTEQVLRGDRGAAGGLETSALALGLAGAAIRYLTKEAELRPQLGDDATRLDKALQKCRGQLHALAQALVTPDAAQNLRARANALVLRATQAALAASKGSGFLRDHPAQRWARQALFFLVWSCPWPVTAATMAYLTGPEDGSCADS